MKPVRLAVIGTGLIGRKHVELIHTNSHCRLVGTCDVDAGRRAIADQYKVPFYQDLNALLDRERPEGVIIATPNSMHSASAEICAGESVHVLIEKPIADTLDEAHRIIRVTDEAGIQVLVGHHRRHNPLIIKARSMVKGGALGRLVAVSVLWALLKPDDYYKVEWRCRPPGGGPTLINLIHEFDSLRFICGEIRQVYAQSSSAVRKLDVEDTLNISFSFENGTLGSVLASDTAASPWSYETTTRENPYYYHAHENCYHFLGSKGSLAFPRMELWRYMNAEQSGWQHPLEKTELDVARADPLNAQLEHFCRVIRNKEKPIVDGRDAARSLAVALAVQESIQCQGPVDISGITHPSPLNV